MAPKKMAMVIQLIGPPGSGKTTLARLFMEMMASSSVLAVDASTDNFLALTCGVSAAQSVSAQLERMDEKQLSRESMDWLLQDLPQRMPDSEVDVVCLGEPTPTVTSSEGQSLLQYGLPRLFSQYDIVIWDGALSVFEPMLTGVDMRALAVITADSEAYCQQLPEERLMVLLSKVQSNETLPPTAAKRAQEGVWQFLGKLPALSPPEKRVKELPAYFTDCFYRLDLPFKVTPPLV